jgi:uncharacterized protein involved in oxidation of intracellular sulfur
MNVLLILNDAPYGGERSFNALRLVTALGKRDEVEVRTFLMGDAVGCALADQQTPEGYYNVARLMRGLIARNAAIGFCGTCLDTRGLASAELVDGAQRSTMDELAEWVTWADQILTF